MATVVYGTGWQNYGGLFVRSNAVAETTTDATPRKIAAFDTLTVSNKVTGSLVTNDLEVTDAGDYALDLAVCFSGTPNKTYFVTFYVNGLDINAPFLERKLGPSGDVGSGSHPFLAHLNAGDKVSLYHFSSDGGTLFTLQQGILKVELRADD
jgi:hypothetical protein